MTIEHDSQTLLELARAAARESRSMAESPEETEQRLLAAWAAAGLADEAADDRFWPDPTTGVEGLAFVVGDDDGRMAGLVLRLPGEYPDSFEAVSGAADELTGPADVRARFFGGDRGR